MDSRSEPSQARPTALELAETLRKGVAHTRFEAVDWVTETGSTNRDLLQAATDELHPDRRPAVLVTDHQTAGRGTKGRSWFDPPGGSLLLSVRLFPDVGLSELHLLTMALSVAAAEACQQVAGVAVGLKWPNDLFVEDRKLAGVLAETSIRAGVLDVLVIGIGLNVNWPAAEVPADLGERAVALNELAGVDVDRAALAVALIVNLDAQLDRLAGPGGPRALRDAYRQRSATLGRTVRLELPGGARVGEVLDFTTDGHLVVNIDGERHTYAAVDVTHLRHTP